MDNNELKEQKKKVVITTTMVGKVTYIVFFTSTSELHILNKAILYARDNENCASLIIAHICSKDEKNEIKVRLK